MLIQRNKFFTPEKVIISLVVLFLSCLLFLSILIQYRQIRLEKSTVDPDLLVAYANLFLEDQPRAKAGKLMDCSGFTRMVFKKFSLKIPYSSYEQYKYYGGIAPENLLKGDLVFFNTSGKGVSHVGIYIEDGMFLHSPGFNRYVRIDSMQNSYWEKRFISGGRVIFGEN